jgi:hypothetical protein
MAYEIELPVTLVPEGLCPSHPAHDYESPPPPQPATIVASATADSYSAPALDSAPPPPPPEQGVIRSQVGICSLSGARAHAGCQHSGSAYQTMLLPGEIPTQQCIVHQEVVEAEPVDENELPEDEESIPEAELSAY